MNTLGTFSKRKGGFNSHTCARDVGLIALIIEMANLGSVEIQIQYMDARLRRF